jgi:hypothetical protein
MTSESKPGGRIERRLLMTSGGSSMSWTLAGLLVAEVRVRGQVGAIAGGLALVVDLTDQAAADEGFEAVIDRGEGDAGHNLAGAVEDLVDRGVVALGQEDREDGFTLGGDLLAALYEGFLKVFLVMLSEISNHSK